MVKGNVEYQDNMSIHQEITNAKKACLQQK